MGAYRSVLKNVDPCFPLSLVVVLSLLLFVCDNAISAASDEGGEDSSTSTIVIAAATGGGLLLLVVAVVAIVVYCYRRDGYGLATSSTNYGTCLIEGASCVLRALQCLHAIINREL